MKSRITKYFPTLILFFFLGLSFSVQAQPSENQPTLSPPIKTKTQMVNQPLTEKQKLENRIKTLQGTVDKLDKRIVQANKDLAIQTAEGKLTSKEIESRKKTIQTLTTQSEKIEKLIKADKAKLEDM